MRQHNKPTAHLLRATAMAGMVASLCTGCATEVADVGETADDLTSNTALARDMTFKGVVFVDATASSSTIAATIKKQTQSGFGALRTATIMPNHRELGVADPSLFVKTAVDVVDPAQPTAAPKKMLRVEYTYKDTAVVPKSFSKRSSLSLALLSGNYNAQTQKILLECTDNDKEAQDFQSSIWYVFNPSLSVCKAAIAKEQKAIDADRAKLKNPKTQVPLRETARLYLPITVALVG
ncbi:MAG: hypothetical protein HY902_02350, partial [Deltaproteobacteria bacterium]|nr:hypothetical protein [Deltaproteobacteria bacterium]